MALLAATPLWVSRLAAQDAGAPPPVPAQEQPEVLSRGPVHEAFAEPVSLQFEAGVTVPDQPPPSIEEVPPAERPQGEQFAWVPGYWSWDADRNGYIWVSACWRVAPPRMSWVPGYWYQVSAGWQWVAGFWAAAGVREIEYLPAPPPIDSVEPYGPPPSQDTIWVPPCMWWAQGQYVRRAGYWLAAQPNWVWVPAHYVVTPRGYIFAEGHWDYSLERRGMLFAPTYFPASFYGRVGFTYSPSIILDMGLLRASLFAFPRYSHYFFGDYYDDAYLRLGIFPWFDSQRLHSWYDPLFEHDRWQHRRSEPRWEERERDEYARRRSDRDLRPARTYREQESRLAKLPEPQRRALQMAQPVAVAVSRRDTPLRFTRISADARQTVSRQATAVRTFRDERNRWESAAAGPRTALPSGQRAETPVTRAPERRETVQPPAERSAPAALPAVRRDAPERPAERSAPVALPAVRRDAPERPAERSAPVAPAAVRRDTPERPAERRAPVASPAVDAPRAPAVASPRDQSVPRPERVQIPVSPVVGGSGAPGIFRRGPPSRPVDEDKDEAGGSIRNNRAANRDPRQDGSGRGRK